METVKQGETVKKLTVINGLVVSVQRATKVKETDKVATKCNWELDFTNCPQEVLLELASRSIVIDLQRDFRAGKVSAEGTFQIPRPESARVVDPVKAANNALEKLTKEQLAAILAAHQEKE